MQNPNDESDFKGFNMADIRKVSLQLLHTQTEYKFGGGRISHIFNCLILIKKSLIDFLKLVFLCRMIFLETFHSLYFVQYNYSVIIWQQC